MPAEPARLLLAIATGQAVANVPPLLHVGRPGDSVCWLWSDGDALASAEATSQLLGRRGLEARVHPEPLPPDLRDVNPWWQRHREQAPIAGRALTLMGNGGTKPLFTALLQAMAGDIDEVVYGEGQPVSVLRMPGGLAAHARREDFTERAVALQDVLTCTGHHLFLVRGQSAARLLWRNGERLHPLGGPIDPYMYPAAFCDAFLTGPPASRELDERRRRQFEEAVAHRVLHCLQQNPNWRRAIVEVWLGVVLARDASPETPAADWDVALVLRNGVVINIECKTGYPRNPKDMRGEKKELDARLLMTHTGGSILAEMWVCSPMPTAVSDQVGFDQLHGRRQRTLLEGRRHIAWTLPDQPRSYWRDSQRFEVPPFEQQLDELIQPYLP